MSPKDEDELNPEEKKNSDDTGGEDSSGDDFGLGDDMSFKPIDRDQPDASSEEGSTTEDQSAQEEPVAEEATEEEEPVIEDTTDEEEPKPAFDKSKYEQKSKAPLIIGLLVAALILGGGGYYFFVARPAQQEEKARLEAIAKEKARKASEEKARLEQEARDREEEERLRREAEEAIPTIGTVTTISDRTGRSYVVVGSFFDADFAQDFGNELAQTGVSSSVLSPADGRGFHRVAIEGFDTFDEAMGRAADLRGGDYGEDVWAIKF